MAQQFIYAFVSILLFSPTLFADIIVLSSGERIEVIIVEEEDSFLKVHHEILGDFTVQKSNISRVERSSKTTAGQPSPPEEENEQSRWNQDVRLGVGYQRSQKESADVSLSYHADREQNEHRVSFDIDYRMAESENEKTLNRFTGIWGNTWAQSDSPWDIFTNLQFDWAEFQSWDQRLLGDVGVKYDLLATEDEEGDFTLSMRVGSGFRQEFNSNDDELIPEGLLGLNIEWNIELMHSLTAESTWYPDYNDSSNYRVVTNAQWNVQLDSSKKLLFSIGAYHEYDSVVDAGIKKSDLQLTAGIKYIF